MPRRPGDTGVAVVISAAAGGPRRAMVIGAAATVVGSLPVMFTGSMAVQLSRDLAFGRVGIGAAVAAFFAAMAISAIGLGRLADRLGATLSLRLATVATAGAGLGIALVSRNWASLSVWLVLAGLAASLTQPAANRLLINRVRRERLGAAFGLKQSAPPAATLLAGLSVPAIALTVGWRWAYGLVAVCALGVAVAVGPPPPASLERARTPRSQRPRREPLRDRPTLVVLASAFGIAFAASSVALAFYVDAAVAAETPERLAGLAFALASLVAIVVRIGAGFSVDRFTIAPLVLCAALLCVGTVGFVLLSTGRPGPMVLGAVLALSGSWGFPGVFWFALVSAYPDTPGRITGAMAPAASGGIVGPIGFGALASAVGYPIAWRSAAGLAVLAAVAMLLGARRLAAAEARHREEPPAPEPATG